MRVLFVQTGDFRAAAERLAATGVETYHAQRYSVTAVEDLADGTNERTVATLCLAAPEPYRVRLPSGVEAIGHAATGDWAARMARARDEIAAFAPTHLVLRLPEPRLIRWALDNKVAVFPVLADSFGPRPGIRGRLDRHRFAKLGRLMNRPEIPWIGNHNLAASRDLVRIGVDPKKIIPWDWPREPGPDAFEPKRLNPGPHRLLALGAISEAKGTGDAIRAFAARPALAKTATLDVIGKGETEAMQALAAELGVADRVRFPGPIPFHEVMPTMRAHDVVLVMTRPAYGEGMPGTIYQALAARTPLIISDHRMFTAYLSEGEGVSIAPAAAPEALADAVLRLLGDGDLYARLSEATAPAFAKILHPVRWGDVLTRWLSDGEADRAWLAERALPAWDGRA